MKIRDVTFQEFYEETTDKKYICIGCGKLLNDLFLFGDKAITDRIEIISDNNKAGNKLTYNGKEYDIRSVEELSQLMNENVSIIVTTMFCKDIVNQLNSMKCDLDVSVYSYTVMSMRVADYMFPFSNDEKIPRKIHWVWVGKGEVPDKNKRYIESWHKYCPDYEIIRWDENNYDVTKCRYMKEAYEANKWGFVSDYARLDIVYHEGGFYLDTDVELVKSFDDFLGYEGVMGFQRNFQINLGHGFGAAPRNDILNYLMQSYENRKFINENGYDLTSCPMIQTSDLIEMGLKCNNMIQRIGGIEIFPSDVFDPKGAPVWEPNITDRTHSIHHYDESWLNEEQKKVEYNKYRQIEWFRNRRV